MRKFLGTLAGIVAAMVAITLVEVIGHAVYPPQPGLDMNDPAVVAAYIERVPFFAKFFVVAAWFTGALAGGWVALRLSGWPVSTWLVAALIAAGGIFNATQIPAPLWMQLSTVLAPALGGWLALHLPGWRRVVV